MAKPRSQPKKKTADVPPRGAEHSPEERPKKPRVFVSYASEDRPIAKHIADTITRYGKAEAWYDQYEIHIGDSLLQKVNDGLRESEYGIALLSPSYFEKNWTMQELGALANLIQERKLFPIRRNLTPEELRERMPTLGDIRSESADHIGAVRSVVAQISRVIAGPRPVDNKGRLRYFRETVSIADFPLDEDQCVTDVSFEECVIQGLAVLTLRDSRSYRHSGFRDIFPGCYWNHPATFFPVPGGALLIGTIGLRDVLFKKCRFKDIGITAPADDIEYFRRLARDNPPRNLPDYLM